MSNNPYAATSTTQGLEVTSKRVGDEQVSRFTRFVAAMVDGILLSAIVMPVQIVSGFLGRAATQQTSVLEQLMMSVIGILVMLALNGYLLLTRGQTIGKMATKIQIVDAQTGALLLFSKVYIYRYLWYTPLVLLVLLIPGEIDNNLISLVILINVLLIFRRDRRCLHDLIAGSKVVHYQAGRPKIT